MNPELLEQRKKALQYNREKGHMWTSFCQPLKAYLDIDWVIRTIFHLNSQGQVLGYQILATNTDYAADCMFRFKDNGKSFTQAIQETPFGSYSYFLWPNGDDCVLIQAICQEFVIPRGLVIYKRNKESIEGWSFGSKSTRAIPNIITQASVLPFHNFINYFNKQQTLHQLSSPFVSYFQPFDMSYIEPPGKMEDFEAFTQSNRFILNIEERPVSLSKREWECLSSMAQGKTYKGVANLLSLSPRTVESYLNQIREKTEISSKAKLIDYFREQTQSFLE